MNATLEELKGEKLKSREEPKDKPRRGGTWDDVIRAIDFPRYFFFFFFKEVERNEERNMEKKKKKSRMLKEWASLYTSSEDLAVKGLYLACDITPYVHAITSHLPSMLCRCLESGLTLRYFSCAAQEKKNHLQVFYAQEKTFKGGLRPAEVEESILMQEGRRILFIHKHASILAKNGFDVSALIESPKPLQIYL